MDKKPTDATSLSGGQKRGFSMTTVEEQLAINSSFIDLAKQEALLPIKVSNFYQRKIDEEVAAIGSTDGPLHRVAYPSQERILLKAPNEVPDFVDDRSNMPPGLADIVIHKYRERLLFLPTPFCVGHCQYCFRQDVLTEQHTKEKDPLVDRLNALDTYLANHDEVTEVILSGGDPMILPYEKLKLVLDRIKQHSQVESIRIHTRTTVFSPTVLIKSCDLLAKANVRLVSHIVHPYEICDTVAETLQKLVRNGVRCYSQFPLLRKINDHPKVLLTLLKRLDELGVRNLSIFLPDAIKYSAAFRIRFDRILSIIDELNWSTPSWINATRFVLDSPYGKVRRGDLKYYDHQSQCAVFERDRHEVHYPDIPESMDEPGQLDLLLWKERGQLKNPSSAQHTYKLNPESEIPVKEKETILTRV
jgi:lysine 2,3-aminomutase